MGFVLGKGIVKCLWTAVGMLAPPAGRVGAVSHGFALLASMFIWGSVAEPVSHKIVTCELPPPDMAVALANIVVPALLFGGALVSLIGEGDDKLAIQGRSLTQAN